MVNGTELTDENFESLFAQECRARLRSFDRYNPTLPPDARTRLVSQTRTEMRTAMADGAVWVGALYGLRWNEQTQEWT